MTVHSLLYLRCDHRGCRQKTKAYVKLETVVRNAREDGWQVDGAAQFCWVHSAAGTRPGPKPESLGQRFGTEPVRAQDAGQLANELRDLLGVERLPLDLGEPPY